MMYDGAASSLSGREREKKKKKKNQSSLNLFGLKAAA